MTSILDLSAWIETFERYLNLDREFAQAMKVGAKLYGEGGLLRIIIVIFVFKICV